MTWACWVQIIIGVKAAYRGEKLSAVARIFNWRVCGATALVREEEEGGESEECDEE